MTLQAFTRKIHWIISWVTPATFSKNLQILTPPPPSTAPQHRRHHDEVAFWNQPNFTKQHGQVATFPHKMGGGSVEGDMGDRHLLSVGRLFCLSLGLRWSSLNVSIVICAVILFVFEGLIFSQNQWKVHQYSNYKRSLNRDYSFAVIFVEGDTCNKWPKCITVLLIWQNQGGLPQQIECSVILPLMAEIQLTSW